jgi:hypothetical protein
MGSIAGIYPGALRVASPYGGSYPLLPTLVEPLRMQPIELVSLTAIVIVSGGTGSDADGKQ